MSTQTEWLTRREVADRLKFSPKTLAKWATEGKGPKYERKGNGHCRYRLSDVVAWEEAGFN
ncbi:helix-turn-helix transcriptional regulator [Nocardia brasiliensis]|uniref:helix-turn-helix transcriptional regulator n=1 Tax=Nocardia brasiliensis TaxID=37326 RepID=UPI0024585BCB|nr:helix-turn-helix domain-containing protein [Nocardia brasiliensis]